MSRGAVIYFVGIGGVIQFVLLGALSLGYLIADRLIYVPSALTFVLAFVASGLLCARRGYRVSGSGALAACGLAYAALPPLFSWVDILKVPQDFGILALDISLAGIALAPSAALGAAVLNGVATSTSRTPIR